MDLLVCIISYSLEYCPVCEKTFFLKKKTHVPKTTNNVNFRKTLSATLKLIIQVPRLQQPSSFSAVKKNPH